MGEKYLLRWTSLPNAEILRNMGSWELYQNTGTGISWSSFPGHNLASRSRAATRRSKTSALQLSFTFRWCRKYSQGSEWTRSISGSLQRSERVMDSEVGWNFQKYMIDGRRLVDMPHRRKSRIRNKIVNWIRELINVIVISDWWLVGLVKDLLCV